MGEHVAYFIAGFLLSWGIGSWLRAKNSREWDALHKQTLANWEASNDRWKEAFDKFEDECVRRLKSREGE